MVYEVKTFISLIIFHLIIWKFEWGKMVLQFESRGTFYVDFDNLKKFDAYFLKFLFIFIILQ